MRWVAFGTYDRMRHPRVGVLLDGLRASGDEVIEVNEPLRLDTAGRVAMLRQPWRLPVLAGQAAAVLDRCWRGGPAAVRREPPDAVLVGYLGHFDVRLARRLFRRTPDGARPSDLGRRHRARPWPGRRGRRQGAADAGHRRRRARATPTWCWWTRRSTRPRCPRRRPARRYSRRSVRARSGSTPAGPGGPRRPTARCG